MTIDAVAGTSGRFLPERGERDLDHHVAQSDHVIDYHWVGLPGIGFSHLYTGGTKDARETPVWEATIRLAQAAGPTILVAGLADTLTGCAWTPGSRPP